MKTIYKVLSFSVLAIFAIVLVNSTTSMAIESEPKTTTEPRQTTVEQKNRSIAEPCSRFSTLATTMNAKLAERMSAMKTDFAKRLSNVDSRHEAVDQKVMTFRTSLGDKFDTKLAELRSKEGVTEAKLAAIDTYEQAMKTAEAAREEAVDQARATYRAALAQQITEQQTKLSQAATEFQAAVRAAFEKAKADCSNGTAGETLKTAIKNAREVFESSRKSDATKTSIKQLAETRTKAIKAANAEFKKSAEAATKALKAVL